MYVPRCKIHVLVMFLYTQTQISLTLDIPVKQAGVWTRWSKVVVGVLLSLSLGLRNRAL